MIQSSSTKSSPDNAHYHWHVCTVCGAVDEETKALCTPIYEHDAEGHEGQHHQICEICKAEITEWTDHVWGEEIKHDDTNGLDYVDCVCGARFYDELVEVIIGEVSYTIGENAPNGTMLVSGPADGKYTVTYTDGDIEADTIRCRLFVNGVWDGEFLEDRDGSYEITPGEGNTYKVVLEAANATGISTFEKIIGL